MEHYDEIINHLLNTCIILVGKRSDLFNSGVKRGRDIFKIQGELAKRGSYKIQGESKST